MVPFKTFLVPVPFPLVTMFETADTYKKWLWTNSTYITYTWHALLLWHMYLHTYIYVYVIARVGVKFGINFTSVSLSGNKIARGEAECYLPLNLTRVKFVPEISRLTVLLKINTIASLLFIQNILVLSSLARQ